MIEKDGCLRTDDMAFAAILIMEGYHPRMVRNGERAAIWEVKPADVDEDTQELIDDYLSGQYLVEPKRFLREVKNVRDDLYRFLGVSKRGKGRPGVKRGQPSSSH